MAFTLPPLPYDKTRSRRTSAPRRSSTTTASTTRRTSTNLNKLLEGKPEASKSLEEVIMSSDGGVFNNAAQVWNHTFYWSSMKPNGGGQPTGDLLDGDQHATSAPSTSSRRSSRPRARRSSAPAGRGSSTARTASSRSRRRRTPTCPMKHGQKALLTMDVWEHAYYIDYRNARPKYIETFLKSLANWDFALENLKKG